MNCVSGKVTFPDLQSALMLRDKLIGKYHRPFLAYKCYEFCQFWHLTSDYERYVKNRRVRKWNNINTAEQMGAYNDRIGKAEANRS